MNGRDKLPWFPIDQLPMAYIVTIMAKEINIDHCQVSQAAKTCNERKKHHTEEISQQLKGKQ
jgi:hypothetical protein